MNTAASAVSAVSTLAAVIALAAYAPEAHADVAVGRPWMNAGASEIVVIPNPAHYAVYGYLAVTLPIDLDWHQVYLIPGLSFELAPEVDRGGLVGSVTLERSLSARVAADFILSLAHDQGGFGDWDGAIFSLGVGAGVSIVVGDFALSPALYVYRTIDSSDWSLAPTLNLAHSL